MISVCGVEFMFGYGKVYFDYVYYFIGIFIGGGVVLNLLVFIGCMGIVGVIGLFFVCDEYGKLC